MLDFDFIDFIEFCLYFEWLLLDLFFCLVFLEILFEFLLFIEEVLDWLFFFDEDFGLLFFVFDDERFFLDDLRGFIVNSFFVVFFSFIDNWFMCLVFFFFYIV